VGSLLLELLPITLLSAFTPWTVVGVIVLLAARNGVRKAIAFTLGWFTAILALGALVIAGVTGTGGEQSSSVTWLQIGLQIGFGLALLLFAHNRWNRRPPRGVATAEPRWIGKLDGIGTFWAFAFGAFWINGFLVVPAALQISRAEVTGPQKAFALLFYAVGASSLLIAAIAYRVLSPDRAGARLAALRTWVGQNSTATVAGVVGVIGAGLLLKAAVELAVTL
jgi:Sap, sulfolipid-1-addressing protein